MDAEKWTTPYFGVTHMNGLKPGFQITVATHGDELADATIFAVHHRPLFDGLRKQTFTGPLSLKQAKEWAEEQARDLDLFARAAA